MMPSPLARAVVASEQGRFQTALPSATGVNTGYQNEMLGAMAKIFAPQKEEDAIDGTERFGPTVNHWTATFLKAKARPPILERTKEGRSHYAGYNNQITIDPKMVGSLGHELAHSNQSRSMGGFLRMMMMGPAEKLYYGDDKRYTTKGTVENEATVQGNIISAQTRNAIAKDVNAQADLRFEKEVEMIDPNRLVRNLASISATQY